MTKIEPTTESGGSGGIEPPDGHYPTAGGRRERPGGPRGEGYTDLDPEYLESANPYRGIRRFLVYCSGAEPHILSHSPTEQATYLTIGGTVLATGVLAAMSVTFALTMAFDLPLLAVLPVALIWGLVIFNLDRWLVASYRRMDRLWMTLWAIIPRLALAFLFGLIISEPLILRIFDFEIEEQIKDDQAALIDDRLQAVDEGRPALERQRNEARIEELVAARNGLSGASRTSDDPVVSELQAEIDGLREENLRLEAEIGEATAAVAVAQEALTEEIARGCADAIAGCRPGDGPIAQQKREALAAAQQRLNAVEAANQPIIAANTERVPDLLADIDGRRGELSEEAASLGQELAVERGDLNREIDDLRARNAELTTQMENEKQAILDDPVEAGLLARIAAFDTLRDESDRVALFHRLLQALFVAIDCIPILGKALYTMGEKKPYEKLRASIEADIDHDIERAADARAVELDGAASTERYRTSAVAANQQDLINYAVAIQRNLGRALLREWEQHNLPAGTDQVDPDDLPDIGFTVDISGPKPGGRGQVPDESIIDLRDPRTADDPASANGSSDEQGDEERHDPDEETDGRVAHEPSETRDRAPSQPSRARERARTMFDGPVRTDPASGAPPSDPGGGASEPTGSDGEAAPPPPGRNRRGTVYDGPTEDQA